jgi:hypothetical protein
MVPAERQIKLRRLDGYQKIAKRAESPGSAVMTLRLALTAAVGLGFLAAALGAGAQQTGKVWRIGVLQTAPPKDEADNLAALEKGLAELGYSRGRNVLMVSRNAGG